MTPIDYIVNCPNSNSYQNFPSIYVSLFIFIQVHEFSQEDKKVFNREKLKYSLGFFASKLGIWECIFSTSVSEFCDETPFHFFPPSSNINIFKLDIFAWISLVASYNSRG